MLDVQEGWLCGTQRVDVRFGRADSSEPQDTAARAGVTSGFVLVASSWPDHLRIHACAMRAGDTHGEPVIPDTSFPTPEPWAPGRVGALG